MRPEERPTTTSDGFSLHVIHRGNNHMNVFVDDYDRYVFLELIRIIVERFAILVHAFVVLSTHDHLIVTATTDAALPAAMKSLAGRYTKYFNKKYSRCGTLWMPRYRAKLIRNDRYALTCLRYLDQNPVRASLVAAAEGYRWSSHAAYVSGIFPPWLTPHASYLGLGSTPVERQASYRSMFERPLSEPELIEQRFG
jgi:putative transposase